jgi:hypothetical protein
MICCRWNVRKINKEEGPNGAGEEHLTETIAFAVNENRAIEPRHEQSVSLPVSFHTIE